MNICDHSRFRLPAHYKNLCDCPVSQMQLRNMCGPAPTTVKAAKNCVYCPLHLSLTPIHWKYCGAQTQHAASTLQQIVMLRAFRNVCQRTVPSLQTKEEQTKARTLIFLVPTARYNTKLAFCSHLYRSHLLALEYHTISNTSVASVQNCTDFIDASAVQTADFANRG